MERAKRKAVLSAFMTFLALSLWSSCTTEDQLHFQTSAAVEATFRLKPATAVNGKITIREAYLKLDRIQATGNLGGNNNTDITHPVPPEGPPFQLSKSDSSEIDFNLPFRIYDRLDFHLFLFQDAYDLVYQESPEISDPVEDDDDGQSPDGGQEENGAENKNEDDGSDPDNNANDDGNGDDHSDDGEDDDGDDDDGDDNDDSDSDGDEDEAGEEDDDEDDGDDKKDNDKKDKKGDKKKDADKKDKNKDRDKGHDDDDDDDDGRTGKAGRQIVNLAEFFQNARPGMIIMGTYDNNGRIINIIFVATGIEQITVPAKQNDSFSIMLKEKNSAAITFNPEVLFDGINPGDIESAQIQNYQQQEVLFIHRDFNSELFQILAPRLEPSASLNFGVKNL